MSGERREIIRGMSLDVDILARELYGRAGTDLEIALRAIDRMLASLGRLREQLTREAQAKDAGR